ncbi:hypothetical protein [Glycomyces sp. NRRL B-16210]|uniref:hypothetical protein n=1 Tax=Glycomyces sp. NRRL B-16210 TaxID=1463821 RepID=UPI0004BE7064|nr:hypothetical protein [Glycomyces sp. NRRL B-16210]
MHLESWAGFGLTEGFGRDSAVAGLAPYLLGYQPSETLVALGLNDGQPFLTATWPLERLTDHNAYAEPIRTWASQCDDLYVLLYSEEAERCFDAAEALWHECHPEIVDLDRYRTIAVSRRGWSKLNDFDRYSDDSPFEDHWSSIKAPHPVLARLFALAWQQQLGDFHWAPARDEPANEAGSPGPGPIRVADSDLIPWARTPAQSYAVDLTSNAFALAEVFDAIWQSPDPALLNIAYWRTTGRGRSRGTGQALIASLAAFARWRWEPYGAAEEAAADAVDADPTSAIARAVARLVCATPGNVQAGDQVWAPMVAVGRYGGPVLPVIDVPLHIEIRALVEPAVEALLDPSSEVRNHRCQIAAVCGTSGQLHLAHLEHLLDTSTPLASRRLADIAAAAPARVGLANVWGVAEIESWGRTQGTATIVTIVLLDGAGQVHRLGPDEARPTWTALPATGRTGGWKREGLFRLAQALLRAERH